MDRRNFIKGVSAGSAALSVSLSGRGRAASGKSLVSVGRGEDYKTLVSTVLKPLGGIEAFVKKGHKVALKPNISFDRTPEQGANVHPDVLKAMIELCLDAGASDVLVFDRVLAEERRCYEQSGANRVIKSIGDDRARLVHPEDRDFVKKRIEKGLFFRTWQFYKPALEADAYINLPIAKHHGSAKLTLGLKNILGVIGGNRGKVHMRLDQGIADLNTVLTPDLTVIDATRILLRNCPSGGNLEDVEKKDTLIASTDTVAADAYAAKNLFGMSTSELGYIEAAHELGLGEKDLGKVKVVKA